METRPTVHVPVLAAEVLARLDPQPGQIVVDGTLGGGGHTRALAQRVAPNGCVIALDRDSHALLAAERSLAGLCVQLVASDFRDLEEVLKQLNIPAVAGVLLDLGLSSDQLADTERGFSFDSTGPLDLRFDTSSGEPAWQLLERLDAEELANVIYEFGEERHSRRIARAIVEQRKTDPIKTADQLASLVRRVLPGPRSRQRIDSATRTFQALRIAVNDELGSLQTGLKGIAECLAPLGRVAVISFHSLEDRIVKQTFRDDPRFRPLLRKPIVPGEAETHANPRARSAKLRVAERVDASA